MKQSIHSLALLVTDYDEAIEFYTQKLNFQLVEDTIFADSDKRWVLISPSGNSGVQLLLAKAVGEQQKDAVGNQAGGRVFLFLETDDFWRDYAQMSANNVIFKESPRKETYGTVAVFQDLYGNLWDLIEHTAVPTNPPTQPR